MVQPPTTFPFYRFEGSHHEIGVQYGAACAELIHLHLDLAVSRLEQRVHVRYRDAVANALAFRPYVQTYAPFMDEEIQGVAAGSGLSLEQAYLLQLRAELGVISADQLKEESGDECTTFAILPEATVDGIPMIGQNADLPDFYNQISSVVEFVFDDMPSVLMLTPAGQVSYIGINDAGLGVCANSLNCDGWRGGYPRYLLSRLALTQGTVDDAIATVDALPRASSRNLLFLDSHGNAADLENIPTRTSRIDPVNGLLAHANHYLSTDLLDEERSKPRSLANSRNRQALMERRLAALHGKLDHEVMKTILRDRSEEPDCLCRMEGDEENSDVITFASLIAEPTQGQMWVAVGPPNQHSYTRYAFSTSDLSRKTEPVVLQA